MTYLDFRHKCILVCLCCQPVACLDALWPNLVDDCAPAKRTLLVETFTASSDCCIDRRDLRGPQQPSQQHRQKLYGWQVPEHRKKSHGKLDAGRVGRVSRQRSSGQEVVAVAPALRTGSAYSLAGPLLPEAHGAALPGHDQALGILPAPVLLPCTLLVFCWPQLLQCPDQQGPRKLWIHMTSRPVLQGSCLWGSCRP